MQMWLSLARGTWKQRENGVMLGTQQQQQQQQQQQEEARGKQQQCNAKGRNNNVLPKATNKRGRATNALSGTHSNVTPSKYNLRNERHYSKRLI
jgi:hypothetical protein